MLGCLDWAKKQLLRLPFTFLLPKFRCVPVCVCVCACVFWEDKWLSLFLNMCAVCRGRCFHSLFCCKDSGVFICACACVEGCGKRVVFFVVKLCGSTDAPIHLSAAKIQVCSYVCVCICVYVGGGGEGGCFGSWICVL